MIQLHGPIEAHFKRHIDRFSRFPVFAQETAECMSLYTLQWDAPFPLKIAPSHGGSGPPSNRPYMVTWAHPSPQSKRHLDRCSRFCRDH